MPLLYINHVFIPPTPPVLIHVNMYANTFSIIMGTFLFCIKNQAHRLFLDSSMRMARVDFVGQLAVNSLNAMGTFMCLYKIEKTMIVLYINA